MTIFNSYKFIACIKLVAIILSKIVLSASLHSNSFRWGNKDKPVAGLSDRKLPGSS